ncbi:MAG: hypothetical protein WCF22_22875 [Candidatus Sulfotelmatobacter sp.]
MFRLALASVFLLSIAASSQTPTQIDTAPPEVNYLTVEVKLEGASIAASAFSDLPDAPEPFSGDRTDPPGNDVRNVSRMGAAVPVFEQPVNSSWNTMDRQFILLNVLSTAALVADVETTIHAVGGETKANELNPVFGAHPTRARLYGITLPLNALSFYLSYHAKKTMPTRSIWKISPGVSVAAHTAAAINNLIVARP